MERGHGWTRCILWGGIALGLGTLLYALCSPSSVGCATNLVVLTHAQVTARGCAVFSVAAHVGVGLIVLGAVLLLGGFVLAVRQRRHAGDAPSTTPTPTPVPIGAPEEIPLVPVVTTVDDPAVDAGASRPTDGAPVAPTPPHAREWPHVERRRIERRATERVGPIPPGEDDAGRMGPASLPPGWYGNPDIPGGSVQWWDGTRLVERPH
jgi:hypothetical protein